MSHDSLGGNGRDMTADLTGINAQARDISFMVGFAQSLPIADVSEVAVGGFSRGRYRQSLRRRARQSHRRVGMFRRQPPLLPGPREASSRRAPRADDNPSDLLHPRRVHVGGPDSLSQRPREEPGTQRTEYMDARELDYGAYAGHDASGIQFHVSASTVQSRRRTQNSNSRNRRWKVGATG